MRLPYQELADHIRGEIKDLERLIQKAQHTWPHIYTLPDDQDVCPNLHGFYYGLER